MMPDRSFVLGQVHVDLWRGLFRDEVRTWCDVRPAAGGLLRRQSCWTGGGRADSLFEAEVTRVRASRLASPNDGSED
jgi:hypothetical protein